MTVTADVVVGVDIGTTSTKSIAVDPTGAVRARQSAGYPLAEPQPGWVEQDPDAILAAVVATVRAVAARCGARVGALSFSSAMHSLIGLGADRRPVTAALTWADSRAAGQAGRIRASPAGAGLHRRTGTPLQAMAPLAKLLWFGEERPDVFARVDCWVGIKDYVLLRLTGRLVTDQSVASGTGLFDLDGRRWDDEALRLAGVDAARLPELVPPTRLLAGLTADAATRTGLPAGTPVVVGAGDGPLANLGVGAVRPGVAAVSIGTSGALRVTVDTPAVGTDGALFCYALAEDRWTVGGAITNGGLVLSWLATVLGAEVDRLLAEAQHAPAGSAGLVMLPYLLAERAPRRGGLPGGGYVGLTHEHGRPHLTRAALEGVCQQLALVLGAVRAAGHEVTEVRGTGGFARSPFWRQLLADVLDMPVGYPAGGEGSAFGAALLGMRALGRLDSLDAAEGLVTVAHLVRPDPAAAAVYRSLQPVHADLYDALVPTFAALRRLAPAAPLDTGSGP